MTKPFLAALAGQRQQRPPVWLMRQAGRYLPEYRELRTQAPSFLDFCYTPRLAIEATLQPIRRFGFDAAILFSDILVMPDALGQSVSFEAGEGPRLEPIANRDDFAKLRETPDWTRLAPVFEAVAGVRAALPRETALIGFCGAPWTVASYMIAGRGTPEQAPARLFAYREPELFSALIDRLADASADYLARQVEAGAEAVQVFDSWSGVLPGLGVRTLVRRAAEAAGLPAQGAASSHSRHRLPARRGDPSRPLRRDRGARLRRARHGGRSARRRQPASRAARATGQSRPARARRRRPGARRSGRCRTRRLRAARACVQPRSRHPAGDAHRACRGDAGEVAPLGPLPAPRFSGAMARRSRWSAWRNPACS